MYLQQHFSSLPPLFIACICEVENVAKLEVQSATGDSLVLGWVVVKERSDIERLLLTHPQHAPADDLLLQVVDFCLKLVVFVRPELELHVHLRKRHIGTKFECFVDKITVFPAPFNACAAAS